ncbi:uncharacterized protein [Aegilops tauschii subsp. strangulata]|nr:uncharacterized protein LOC109772700 [Aegilops tauschii subsp. strangulata]
MANFPVNPLAFLPHGMTVEQGPPDRKARVDMALSGHLPLNHDRFLIAETSRAIPVHLRQEARSALADFVPVRGQINCQEMLRNQGVWFSDGLVPEPNVADSPFSAYNDNICASASMEEEPLVINANAASAGSVNNVRTSSNHALQINFCLFRANFQLMYWSESAPKSSEAVPDVFSLARSVFKVLLNPKPGRDNLFFNLPVIPTKLIRFLGVQAVLAAGSIQPQVSRKVACKLSFEDTPGSLELRSLPSAESDSSDAVAIIGDSVPRSLDMSPTVLSDASVAHSGKKRGRKPRAATPLITSEVRRSSRNNMYRGFKVDMPSDSRKRKSAIVPALVLAVPDPAPASVPSPAPAPLSIATIQLMGSEECGIPLTELSEDKLLAPRENYQP